MSCEVHSDNALAHEFKSFRLLHHSKKRQKTTKSQKRGLVTTIQPELDFSRTCGFREVLDNV